MSRFLSPGTRIYQRLLAGDQEEAEELFENYLVHQPLVEVYDTVLIPALALAETHWQLGELNEGKHNFIMESLKEMIQGQGEHQQENVGQAGCRGSRSGRRRFHSSCRDDSSRLSILCLPARSEADEIAAMMLAQVLETSGCRAQAISVTALAGEMVDLVDQCTAADVICISATPPAAVMHARYLSRQLSGQVPGAKLLVGLWDANGDLSKAKERIGCSTETHVVGTLADAQEQIRLLIKPLVLGRKTLQPGCGHAQIPAQCQLAHYPGNVGCIINKRRFYVANILHDGSCVAKWRSFYERLCEKH